MKCSKCDYQGLTYGHAGLCPACYRAYKVHQQELADLAYEARKAREAREGHPAGKAPRQRARQLWVDLVPSDRDGSAEHARGELR